MGPTGHFNGPRRTTPHFKETRQRNLSILLPSLTAMGLVSWPRGPIYYTQTRSILMTSENISNNPRGNILLYPRGDTRDETKAGIHDDPCTNDAEYNATSRDAPKSAFNVRWKVKVPSRKMNRSKSQLDKHQEGAVEKTHVGELIVPDLVDGSFPVVEVDLEEARYVEAVPPQQLKPVWLLVNKVERSVAVWLACNVACRNKHRRERRLELDRDGRGDVLRLVSPEEASEDGAEDEGNGAELECCDGHAESASRADAKNEPQQLNRCQDPRQRVKLVSVLNPRDTYLTSPYLHANVELYPSPRPVRCVVGTWKHFISLTVLIQLVMGIVYLTMATAHRETTKSYRPRVRTATRHQYPEGHQ